MYVPHHVKPGDHKGRLTLENGGQTLALDVSRRVWNFTLPDYLSFLPEMNCYGLPANERDYYRLAHRHRAVLNRVPYSQNGTVHDSCAPRWDGKKLDWTAWDRRFGKAFHDGRNQTPGPAKLVFRCDISRPQWQRDGFDGLLNYNVVNGAMRPYPERSERARWTALDGA